MIAKYLEFINENWQPDREQVTKQVDDIVKSIFDKDKLMNIGIESTLSKVGEDEYEIKVL